jgi:hypothetical protein
MTCKSCGEYVTDAKTSSRVWRIVVPLIAAVWCALTIHKVNMWVYWSGLVVLLAISIPLYLKFVPIVKSLDE